MNTLVWVLLIMGLPNTHGIRSAVAGDLDTNPVYETQATCEQAAQQYVLPAWAVLNSESVTVGCIKAYKVKEKN
jgi:hypothetical protein